MQVYRAYYKIIMKNLSQIMIYFVVFISLTAILANTNSKEADRSFAETKVNIAFINHDTDSSLVEGLKSYLSESSNIVKLSGDSRALQDALFFRQVEYIVEVPSGFTDDLLAGKAVQLKKSAVPDSTSEIYLDSLINKYLNTALIYAENMDNLSEEQLISYIDKDLKQEVEVNLKNSAAEVSKNEKVAFYFNYLAYSVLAILILGICSVMIVYNSTDLKKRNLCTPIRLRSINFQIILGNMSFAAIAWFALIFTSFIMYGSYMFSSRGLLFLLNSLVFTLAALSISFFLGNAVKSKGAMSAATNVVALGTSFISGVFVPQAILGETVLKIASFTPSYWYVKSNNIIAGLTSFNMEGLIPVFGNMMIVLGFAAAILAVTLAITKQNRLSS
ncbi:MAG: ABC transporter permease [Bacillota bacterium]